MNDLLAICGFYGTTKRTIGALTVGARVYIQGDAGNGNVNVTARGGASHVVPVSALKAIRATP